MTTARDEPGPLLPTGPRSRRRPGWWNAATSAQSLRQAERLVPEFAARLGSGPWTPGGATWTRTGTAVFPLRHPHGDVVLRLRRVGAAALTRETAVLAALADTELPARVRALLPRRVAHLELAEWTGVVDAAFPGSDADVRSPGWPAVQDQALDLVDALHRATAREVRIDDRLLDRWVVAPVRAVRAACAPLPGAEAGCRAIEALLCEGLRGRRVRATWVHGDFWAGNLLTTGDVLTGLVDWDLSAPGELPVHDYLQLLLHRRQVAAGRELGATVAGLLREPAWSRDEQHLLGRLGWAFDGELPDPRVLLLLHWVRYAAAMTSRPYTTYSPRVWELRNVRPVLNVTKGLGLSA